MRGLLFALAGWMSAASSSAQPVRAVTEAGDAVVLFSDGVWVLDDGSSILPAKRDGQRYASEWFRYAVWRPEDWTTMNAVEALYDGEIAFVPGGNRDSVVVTMEYVPMESSPMSEGEARQRVVERYAELFGARFPVRQRSVAGHRVSTIDMTDLDPGSQSLVSAVTAPGGAVLINVHVEGTNAPIEAIASRFLMGLEIEAIEDPSDFVRDPCETYIPFGPGFALDVPEGWRVSSRHRHAQHPSISLSEQSPHDGTPSALVVITTDPELPPGDERSLSELADSLLADWVELPDDDSEWTVYRADPWPPGLLAERATWSYALEGEDRSVEVAVLRQGRQLVVVMLLVEQGSAMRYGLNEVVNGVRVCQ
ncbi:MAG: hypothetical protein AAF170_17175 [Bacteroidota bacterium]